jgi:hypothetical protein
MPTSSPSLIPLDPPGIAPFAISPRLRTQLNYFASPAGAPGVPPLAPGEFWFDSGDVDRWITDGVFYLVSPLDTAHMTEVELTEEQEALLNWLKSKVVRHVRAVD